MHPVEPNSIVLSPKNATGVTGAVATKQFSATVLPSEAPQEVTWSVVGTGVTIDQTGLASITAETKAVDAVITGTASNGLEDTAHWVLTDPT